ncbi:MAG: hypothetical protein ABH934_01120 [Chloroflexota bacterium]
MSEHDESEPRNQQEASASSPLLDKWFPRDKRWRTLIFTVVMLAAIVIATNSIITYENTRVVEPPPTNTPPATTPPVNTITPQFIEDRQEAFDSANRCVLVITPGNDDALNESVTALTMEAGNKIRTTDNIYVGVYILAKDESAAGPTVLVRVQYHDDNIADYQWTLREDITLTDIYETYLNFVFIP